MSKKETKKKGGVSVCICVCKEDKELAMCIQKRVSVSFIFFSDCILSKGLNALSVVYVRQIFVHECVIMCVLY